MKKGQFTPETTLIVGLVCAVALLLTTYLGRRALVGFVALFTFLGFSNSDFVVGLPFLLLAVWLLYRSYKVQKEVTARIKAERAAGPATAATAARPSRAEAAAARRAGGRSARQDEGTGRPRGEQALHAEEAGAPRTAAAEAVVARAAGGRRRPTDADRADSGRSAQAPSVTRAERSSSRISLRRRTSERAVGSSPKARSTSTSVSMPMTVE